MLSDEADIQSSLDILLSTRPGERVMRPDYGCNLDELVFEPLTTTFKTYIKDLVATAILYHEPRIEVNKIELEDTGAKLAPRRLPLGWRFTSFFRRVTLRRRDEMGTACGRRAAAPSST